MGIDTVRGKRVQRHARLPVEQTTQLVQRGVVVREIEDVVESSTRFNDEPFVPEAPFPAQLQVERLHVTQADVVCDNRCNCRDGSAQSTQLCGTEYPVAN